MIEINAAVLIIIVEILAVLLAGIAIFAVVAFRRRRKKLQAIAQLVDQIKKQSELRTQETGSFLQEIYQLEDVDLKKAVEAIDKSEKEFFQKLVDSYLITSPELITSMDASVAGLIDVYKELKPRAPEVDQSSKGELEQLSKVAEKLGQENEKLKEELSITQNTITNMISEFGNMFGGGAGHELANYEVVEKVGDKAVSSNGENESQ